MRQAIAAVVVWIAFKVARVLEGPPTLPDEDLEAWAAEPLVREALPQPDDHQEEEALPSLTGVSITGPVLTEADLQSFWLWNFYAIPWRLRTRRPLAERA